MQYIRALALDMMWHYSLDLRGESDARLKNKAFFPSRLWKEEEFRKCLCRLESFDGIEGLCTSTRHM